MWETGVPKRKQAAAPNARNKKDKRQKTQERTEGEAIDLSADDVAKVEVAKVALQAEADALGEYMGTAEALKDYMSTAFWTRVGDEQQNATNAVYEASVITWEKKGAERVKQIIAKNDASKRQVKATLKELKSRVKQAEADKGEFGK